MHDDARLTVLGKKKARTAHQEDRSPDSLHLEERGPCGGKLLPFGEGDGVVPLGNLGSHEGAGLLSQGLQFPGPAFGPLATIADGVERVRGNERTTEQRGHQSNGSFH